MGDLGGDLESLDQQVDDLQATIGTAQSVSSAFRTELLQMQGVMGAASRQTGDLTRAVGTGLRRAFDGLVFDGARLSDALRILGQSMVNAALTQALRPVQNALGGLISSGVQGFVSKILPFEQGATFASGRVQPFARGGVVASPTRFPMRGGTGLMGEAGPEAIMPLVRGGDGKLGVTASGGGAVHVTMNISTPDAEGFRRSRSQIAAQLSRALGRGARNR